MVLEPLTAKRVRFPPGHVEVRLDERYRQPYRELYDRYGTLLGALPVLSERDFDGRPVQLTRDGLDALNRALARLPQDSEPRPKGVFDEQERAKNRLSKRLQHLS